MRWAQNERQDCDDMSKSIVSRNYDARGVIIAGFGPSAKEAPLDGLPLPVR
jgi:hypothetical protein